MKSVHVSSELIYNESGREDDQNQEDSCPVQPVMSAQFESYPMKDCAKGTESSDHIKCQFSFMGIIE